MKKEVILVTGGSGFIGSHLCDRLIDLGQEIVNLDNFCDNYDPAVKERNVSPLLENPLYHLYRGDIRDCLILDQIFIQHPVGTIIHLAALAGVRQSLANPRDYVSVNVGGTVNLLEYAARYRVKRFLFGSSSSVYGNNPAPFKESDRLEQPLSPYAATKLSGEMFCRIYHQFYGFPVCCLRFFTVYGPRQRPEMAIHEFTKRISLGLEVPIFGKGDSERDYTYVDDIIQGIIASLEISCRFEIFNLGNSRTVNLLELVELIGRILGKQIKLAHLPVQAGDASRTWADLTHSGQILGYRPRVDIVQGIELFIQWYRRQYLSDGP